MIETPTRRKLPPRVGPVKCIVVHATGETDLDKITAWYMNEKGLQPHYMISTTGGVRRFVNENTIAYHAGLQSKEVGLYRMSWANWSKWIWRNDEPVFLGDEFSGYRQWRDTWRSQSVMSPLDLLTGEHPNAVSVGIELQSPGIQKGRHHYTDAQYQALAELLVDVAGRHKIKLTRETVLGHSDVSPMRRCNAAGSWDPGPLDFNLIWDLTRTLNTVV